jgi:HEAT repeat protein
LNGLCQALEDIDVMVRAQAAAALGSMKAAAAQKPYLTALLRTLQDSEPAIREIAAHALRDIGREARADLLDCALPVPPAGSWTWVPWAQSSQSVRAALRKALDDRESGVRRAAARALGAITPPNSDDRTEEELIAFWRGQVSDFGYEELLRFAEHRTGTAAEEGP